LIRRSISQLPGSGVSGSGAIVFRSGDGAERRDAAHPRVVPQRRQQPLHAAATLAG
jgi:hypothetical protein